MRVSTIFTFLFAGSAIAAPSKNILKRDLQAFKDAFGAVSSAIMTFDTAVKALTSTADVGTALPDLTDKSNAIVTALQSGTTSVSAQPVLSLTDAINLLSLSSTLTSNANATVTDLISKKSFIDAAGEDGFVVTQLTNVKTAAQAFIAAVVSKVPDSVKSIANSQASQVITALNTGITTFGGTVTRRLF
jgi:hypothetical protein